MIDSDVEFLKYYLLGIPDDMKHELMRTPSRCFISRKKHIYNLKERRDLERDI